METNTSNNSNNPVTAWKDFLDSIERTPDQVLRWTAGTLAQVLDEKNITGLRRGDIEDEWSRLQVIPAVSRKRKITPVSGSDWGQSQLESFGVKFEDCDTLERFLGVEKLPDMTERATTFIETTKDISMDTLRGKEFPATESANVFAKKLYMTLFEDRARESAVDDLVLNLLESLGYSSGSWVVRSRRESPLQFGEQVKEAVADISVIDLAGKDVIRLCVVEDKSVLREPLTNVRADAEAQLIAEGVAAVQQNKGRSFMYMMRVMGQSVTFYCGDLQKLSDAVKIGEEHKETATIRRFQCKDNRDHQLIIRVEREVIVKLLDCIRTVILK